ncbi:MAG TPA: DUF924 family protein [Stellaceae bacterium]|nr:DUF924 family protein [Stellaceae bacterium]
MDEDQQRALLDFWFDDSDEPRAVWFKADAAFDIALGDAFSVLAARAAAGGLDAWAETTPSGALALVLLLDQAPRNLHRGDAAAFACDAKAREAARRAIARGFDRDLPPVRRQFLYLPFEHSEDLADQEQSVRLFASLPDGGFRDNCVDFARRHLATIARFGRFPHRNAAMGRRSTEEEEQFLKGPNAPF